MSNRAAYRNDADLHATRRISTGTKASFKTTELVAYVVAVLGVLIASAVADGSDCGVLLAPGLYALGLPVLRRRKSTFIHGIEDDAREVVDHLARHLAVA